LKNRNSSIRRRRFLITMLYVVAVIWGVQAGRDQPSLLEIAVPLAAAFLVTAACVADSEILGQPLALSLQGFMFFTWPVPFRST
jgi:hypothetical protein